MKWGKESIYEGQLLLAFGCLVPTVVIAYGILHSPWAWTRALKSQGHSVENQTMQEPAIIGLNQPDDIL